MSDKDALVRALGALSYACGFISEVPDAKGHKESHKYLEAERIVIRKHLGLPDEALTLPVRA